MWLCVSIIYMLAATSSVLATHFEDDPRFMDRHYALDIIRNDDTLFLKMRNFALQSPWRCIAMKRTDPPKHGLHFFTLFSTQDFKKVETFLTPMHLSTTPPHRAPNVVSYQIEAGGPRTHYKVLFVDNERQCYILIENRRKGVRACQLFQTSYTVDTVPPLQCITAYQNNCPGRKQFPYDSRCKDLMKKCPIEKVLAVSQEK
uniref:Putative licpodalin-4 1 n=1 Tax=Amblyomma triste TaxID=251400 RepID=A0A023GDY8_AMBTT